MEIPLDELKMEDFKVDFDSKKQQTSFFSKHSHLFIISSIFLLAFIAFLIGFFAIRSQNKGKIVDRYNRLADNIHPTHYDLNFYFNMKNRSYHGLAIITVSQITRTILLNAVGLENISASIKGNLVQDNLEINNVSQDVLRLLTIADLTPGTHYLTLQYDGLVTGSPFGLHEKYYSGLEQTKFDYMIIAKFHFANARKAFPCFDEPRFKAQYSISVTVDQKQTVLSTMPIYSTQYLNDSTTKLVKFITSPPIPTYLLGLVIGEFTRESQFDQFGNLHNIYVPKGLSNKASYLFSVSTKTLSWMSMYLKTFYPLPQLIHVSIERLQQSSFENWGIVLIDDLVFQTDLTSSFVKQAEFVNVITHDNAKTWFGGLTSLDWWNNIWFNDGISCYLSLLSSSELFPECGIWSRHIVSTMKRALFLDSLKANEQLNLSIESTDHLDEILRTVPFQGKGSSLIRMLNRYIGTNNFRASLQLYLNLYDFKTTTPSDLWRIVETFASNSMNVSLLMDQWSTRKGFPYISLHTDITYALFETHLFNPSRNKILTIRQDTFSINEYTDQSSNWTIPISVIDSTSPNEPRWNLLLNETSQTFELLNSSSTSWIKVNFRKSGFYIVKYDENSLEALKAPTVNEILSSADRVDIELDLYLLARAGHVPIVTYLEYIKLFKAITDDYFVHEDISNNLNSLFSLIEYMNASVQQGFTKYVQAFYEPLVSYFESNEQFGKLASLKWLVVAESGSFGLRKVIESTTEMFEDAILNSNMEAQMRFAIFKVNAINNAFQAFPRLVEFSTGKGKDDEAIKDALIAMGFVRNKAMLNAFLKMIFITNPQVNNIALLYIAQIMQAVGSTKIGGSVGWTFVKENYVNFSDKMSQFDVIEKIVEPLLANSPDLSMIDELNQFVKENKIEVYDLKLYQIIDQIRSNERIVKRDSTYYSQYLHMYLVE